MVMCVLFPSDTKAESMTVALLMKMEELPGVALPQIQMETTFLEEVENALTNARSITAQLDFTSYCGMTHAIK